MSYLSKVFLCLTFLTAMFISCSTLHPPRDFEVSLWKYYPETMEFKHKNEDTGEILIMHVDEIDPSEHILISIDDYILERKYQELLIKSCEKWR